jgi:hypothetical protein
MRMLDAGLGGLLRDIQYLLKSLGFPLRKRKHGCQFIEWSSPSDPERDRHVQDVEFVGLLPHRLVRLRFSSCVPLGSFSCRDSLAEYAGPVWRIPPSLFAGIPPTPH